MATAAPTLATWLQDSAVPQARLTPPQCAVLEAAFCFLQQRGHDYFSRRLLSHVLLHARTGLKVAQLARLLGFSRSAASAQQGLSSKEVVQAAQHRLAGRAHGKLLPRFAGPIAQFLHDHSQASRFDLLDFIRQALGVSVSRMALHRFLKKYGLDQASRLAAVPTPGPAAPPAPEPASAVVLAAAPPAEAAAPPRPPAEFFLPPPTTPAPSCSCPGPSIG
jgi:hypothetical protein